MFSRRMFYNGHKIYSKNSPYREVCSLCHRGEAFTAECGQYTAVQVGNRILYPSLSTSTIPTFSSYMLSMTVSRVRALQQVRTKKCIRAPCYCSTYRTGQIIHREKYREPSARALQYLNTNENPIMTSNMKNEQDSG